MHDAIRARIVSCILHGRHAHVFVRSDPDCAEKIVRKVSPMWDRAKKSGLHVLIIKKIRHMLSQFMQEIHDVKAGNLKDPYHFMLVDELDLQIRAGHKWFDEAVQHAWKNHELTQTAVK